MAEVVRTLQQLGMKACPVCGLAESLNMNDFPVLLADGRPPLGVHALGEYHEGDVTFAVRLDCITCGHLMLFDAQRYRTGDEKILVLGLAEDEDSPSGELPPLEAAAMTRRGPGLAEPVKPDMTPAGRVTALVRARARARSLFSGPTAAGAKSAAVSGGAAVVVDPTRASYQHVIAGCQWHPVHEPGADEAEYLLTWEPVSGFEPLTCRLQEVRPRAPSVLAAQITRIFALTALIALGLSCAPVHEPVHTEAPHLPSLLLLCVTSLGAHCLHPTPGPVVMGPRACRLFVTS
jgi:hypothetical protein